MRRIGLVALSMVACLSASAADHNVRVELNTLESTENACRTTFVIENKGPNFESMRLELVVFNTESIVYRRMIIELGPLRAGRTTVKTFALETKCPQIGAMLVNDVTACVPGEPAACLEALTLNSRVKNVRLYK